MQLVEDVETDKENVNANTMCNIDREPKFTELSKPKLSIQRKYLEKIEKQIGIRKWSKAEVICNEISKTPHNFKVSEIDQSIP